MEQKTYIDVAKSKSLGSRSKSSNLGIVVDHQPLSPHSHIIPLSSTNPSSLTLDPESHRQQNSS